MDTVTLEEKNSLLEAELLQNGKIDLYTGDGSFNIKGIPILKRSTGKWKACSFILGTECCERLAYYGISTNLVNYLIGNLNESNVSAARNVTTWTGTCFLTPLIGAVVADEYLGRYWTIVVSSTIYFIGMCTLTVSASVTAFTSAECQGSACSSATNAQHTVFFSGLYLVALGTGGIKPCVSSFGADQFDDTDPRERVQKGSFFNWFYFSICIGSLVSSSLIVWVQENGGWGLGFGIAALSMGVSIGCFLGGTHLYRFQRPRGSPITRMCQVLVAAVQKWRLKVPEDVGLLCESNVHQDEENRKLEHTDELGWLDKAAIVSDEGIINCGKISNRWKLCTVTQVEELKILFRMLPIWATLMVYSAVYAQVSTMFVEQGDTMDRVMIGSFKIPAASLSTFEIITVITCIPVYDRLIIPFSQKFTGEERGFSALQRIAIGLVCTIFAMSAAALVEMVRLNIAQELGGETKVVPMSILWQIPQYFLIGVADLFAYVGKLEFFYEQSPESMRSLCTAFALLTTAVGSYMSSLIVTVVAAVTTAGGKAGWIPDDLNEGHLDYYFWFLAGLSLMNLLVYVSFARKYKKKATYKSR